MSGISPLGSSLSTSSSGSSGSSTAASATSLLSSVGKSLLTTGQAPSVTPASTANTQTISKYQAEYQTLQQQDTAELLYASFLSPTAGLSNADSVLGQAAQLLGSSSSSTTSGSSSAASSGSAATTTSTSSDPLSSIPSVSSILAASDADAQAALTAYANAPAGSSIIDYQA